MSEVNKPTPTEIASQKVAEREAKQAQADTLKAMKSLSENAKDAEGKKELITALKTLTKQVKDKEDQTLDKHTQAAIQTALDASLQVRQLDDPKLRKQALLTLRAIDKSLKEISVTEDKNTDLLAMQQNVRVIEQDLSKSRWADKLLNGIHDMGADKGGLVSDTADSAGPLFGLMKDVVKGLASKIKPREEKELPLLDYAKERELPKTAPTPEPVVERPQVLQPMKDVGPNSNLLPATPQQMTPTIAMPTIHLDLITIEKELMNLGDIGHHALEHIKTIAELMQRQENRERDEAERDQVSNLKNNFKKFKPMRLPTQPTVSKTEDSGNGLGLFGLFGKNGLFKKIGQFILRAGMMVISMLNPANLIRFAKDIYGKAVDIVKGLFGKLGDVIDGAKGAISKLGKFRGLSKVIPFLGAIVAFFDAFDGWTDAAGILGKAEEAVTAWDRVSAAIGSFLGGIIGIADSLLGLVGFDTDFGGFVKEKVATFLADIPGAITKSLDFLDVIMNFVLNLGPMLRKWAGDQIKSIVSKVPFLGDMVFPDEKKEKKNGDVEKSTSIVDAKQEEQVAVPKQATVKDYIRDTAKRIIPEFPSLKSIVKEKEVKEKEEKKQQQLGPVQAPSVQNNQNVTTNNQNIYQSNPIMTRPLENDFRLAKT